MSRRSLARRLSLASTLLTLVPATTFSQSAADLRREVHQVTLGRAREGAARRLELAECRRVLEDFRDKRGRPLAESLATWSTTASDYVRTLGFRDGSFHTDCRSGKSYLVTSVGKPPVFVCPAFHKQAERDPWTAEIWVIHEMLHTLGLGENPPSSREITERVSQRCR